LRPARITGEQMFLYSGDIVGAQTAHRISLEYVIGHMRSDVVFPHKNLLAKRK
jgi:hypothetical protein